MKAASIMQIVFSGFGKNLLITVLASILPIATGIGLTFLMNAVKSKGLRIAFRLIAVFFYCLAPLALLIILYFLLFASIRNPMPPVVAALTLSHLGYFVMRYDKSATALKNILVNSLGLLSSVFLWSTTVGYVGVIDVVKACTNISGVRYNYSYCWIALLICFLVLAVINIPRMILKETMK